MSRSSKAKKLIDDETLVFLEKQRAVDTQISANIGIEQHINEFRYEHAERFNNWQTDELYIEQANEAEATFLEKIHDSEFNSVLARHIEDAASNKTIFEDQRTFNTILNEMKSLTIQCAQNKSTAERMKRASAILKERRSAVRNHLNRIEARQERERKSLAESQARALQQKKLVRSVILRDVEDPEIRIILSGKDFNARTLAEENATTDAVRAEADKKFHAMVLAQMVINTKEIEQMREIHLVHHKYATRYCERELEIIDENEALLFEHTAKEQKLEASQKAKVDYEEERISILINSLQAHQLELKVKAAAGRVRERQRKEARALRRQQFIEGQKREKEFWDQEDQFLLGHLKEKGLEAQFEALKKNQSLDNLTNDNAILTMSGEPHNLGIITNVNSLGLDLFEVKKEDFVGHNINKIVPAPFSEHHDSILRRYLETGVAKVIDRTRQILGITAKNNLVPVLLSVKQIFEEGKRSFVGLCKTVNMPVCSGFFTLNQSMQVRYTSVKLKELWNAQLGDGQVLMPVTDLMPYITPEKLTELISDKGMRFTQSHPDGSQWDMKVLGDTIKIGGKTVYICRMKFRCIKGFLDGTDETSDVLGAHADPNPIDEEDQFRPMVFSSDRAKDDVFVVTQSKKMSIDLEIEEEAEEDNSAQQEFESNQAIEAQRSRELALLENMKKEQRLALRKLKAVHLKIREQNRAEQAKSLKAILVARDDDISALKSNQNMEMSNLIQEQQANQNSDDDKTNAQERLYGQLPKHVADSMKAGKTVAPKNYENLAFLTADIANLEALAAKSSPAAVLGQVDKLYNALDEIVNDSEDTVKISTSGNGYAVVSGIAADGKNAKSVAASVVSLGLAFCQIAKEMESSGESLHLRIGIHFGSAVGGVANPAVPKFTLLGDVVSISGMLEQSSRPMGVHISGTVNDMVKDKFDCDVSESITYKGNRLSTYWVVDESGSKAKKSGRRAAAQ